jgi:hypothetical protein
MARRASPWYWPERSGWYVILNGQRHPLGNHPADAPPPQKRRGKWAIPLAIEQAFRKLLAAPSATPPPIQQNSGGITVAEVFDKYLDWCEKHRSPRTFEWYRDHIQSFMDTLKEPDKLPVPSLKPFHVIEWTDQHPNWSNAYRRGAIIAIQRPFNWADELGYISGSPIKKIKKPQPGRRDNHVTPEDFADIDNPERSDSITVERSCTSSSRAAFLKSPRGINGDGLSFLAGKFALLSLLLHLFDGSLGSLIFRIQFHDLAQHLLGSGQVYAFL